MNTNILALVESSREDSSSSALKGKGMGPKWEMCHCFNADGSCTCAEMEGVGMEGK